MKNSIYFIFILLFTSCNKTTIEEDKPNFQKISYCNGYYDAFGTLIENNQYLYYYTRRGIAHVGDSDTTIIQMKIDKSYKKQIEIKEIYKDSNSSIDVRNIGGGKINDNHYLFLSKYAPKTSQKWLGFGYIKYNLETNNTIYTEIGLNGYDAINPHGHLIQVKDTYYQPIYAQKDHIYFLILLKTVDNGINWSFDTVVYSGTTYYNETSGEYLGKGELKLITRKDVAKGMAQFTSYDYGKSWSSPQNINISSEGTNIPYTTKVNNTLYLCYTDRNDSSLKISYIDKKNHFINPRVLGLAENNNTWFLGYSPILYDNKNFYTLYGDHQGDYKSTKTYFLKFNKEYLKFD